MPMLHSVVSYKANSICAGYGVKLSPFNLNWQAGARDGSAQHWRVQDSCYTVRWYYWPMKLSHEYWRFPSRQVFSWLQQQRRFPTGGKKTLWSHDSGKMNRVIGQMMPLQTFFQFLCNVHMLQRCCALCRQGHAAANQNGGRMSLGFI